MRSVIPSLALVAALGFVGATACTADVHDNTADVHDNNANIENAKVSIETSDDTDNVVAGSTLHVTVTTDNVFLIDPNMTPPSDSVKVAGHLEFFLDDMSTTAMMVTAQESVSIVIPATTPAGSHKLFCRVDKHDGTPTQATSELDFTVKAALSTN